MRRSEVESLLAFDTGGWWQALQSESGRRVLGFWLLKIGILGVEKEKSNRRVKDPDGRNIPSLYPNRKSRSNRGLTGSRDSSDSFGFVRVCPGQSPIRFFGWLGSLRRPIPGFVRFRSGLSGSIPHTVLRLARLAA